jgi:hypothetical protein
MKTRPGENNRPEVTASQMSRRRILILAGCFVLLLLLGWVDYATGYELGFFVFYSLPVGLAAWYLGRWPGVMVALGATATWWLADALTGAKYSSRFSFWWNSTIHFLAFVINAVTIAKIKTDLDQRHELAAKLEATRKALRAAAGLLPACPVCGKPHPATLRTHELDMQEAARTDADFRSALCAECQSSQETPQPRRAD